MLGAVVVGSRFAVACFCWCWCLGAVFGLLLIASVVMMVVLLGFAMFGFSLFWIFGYLLTDLFGTLWFSVVL